MLVQGIDKPLYVDAVLFAVFGVVSSCILDYIVDQIPGSILARLLHIVRVVMIVGGRLLMLIFNSFSARFICVVSPKQGKRQHQYRVVYR